MGIDGDPISLLNEAAQRATALVTQFVATRGLAIGFLRLKEVDVLADENLSTNVVVNGQPLGVLE